MVPMITVEVVVLYSLVSFIIHPTNYHRHKGPVCWGGGGLRSLARIFSTMLSRKSSGVAQTFLDFAQTLPLEINLEMQHPGLVRLW